MSATTTLGNPAASAINSQVGEIDMPVGGALYVGSDDPVSDMAVFDTAEIPPGIAFRRCLGTLDAPEDVTSNTMTAYMDSRAYSGDRFWNNGSISFAVDGTFESGDIPPSRLDFWTSNDNAGAQHAGRINRTGQWLLGTGGVVPFGVESTLTVKCVREGWASVVYSQPASGVSYGLRAHTVGDTSADWPFAVSAGAGSGAFLARMDGLGRLGLGTTSPASALDVVGDVNTSGEFRVDGTKVVGPRQGAIAAPTGGSTVDSEARAALGQILSMLAAHGLIAP